VHGPSRSPPPSWPLRSIRGWTWAGPGEPGPPHADERCCFVGFPSKIGVGFIVSCLVLPRPGQLRGASTSTSLIPIVLPSCSSLELKLARELAFTAEADVRETKQGNGPHAARSEAPYKVATTKRRRQQRAPRAGGIGPPRSQELPQADRPGRSALIVGGRLADRPLNQRRITSAVFVLFLGSRGWRSPQPGEGSYAVFWLVRRNCHQYLFPPAFHHRPCRYRSRNAGRSAGGAVGGQGIFKFDLSPCFNPLGRFCKNF